MSENNRKNIPWTEEEYLLALIVYQVRNRTCLTIQSH